MKVLVTGVAGFIGSNVAEKLLRKGHRVVGIDNLSSYYSTDLKRYRLEFLEIFEEFHFLEFDLTNRDKLQEVVRNLKPEVVLHLAAQPGVRLPLDKIHDYVDSNLVGFSNTMQATIMEQTPLFIYASSSSVYGDSNEVPFREDMIGIEPKSFYGATKLSNEILSSSLLGIGDYMTRAIGLRLFTVYGPKGRPDMAYFKIAKAFNSSKEFELFGDGSAIRDFTFIDDVTESIEKLISYGLQLPGGSNEILNIGGGNPRSMEELINIVAARFQGKGLVKRSDSYSLDMAKTMASTEKLKNAIDYLPATTLEQGIEKFIDWFQQPEVILRISEWK